jgi:hypothetical protein
MKAELDEVSGREYRGVAVVTDQDQQLVDSTEVNVAPRAVDRDPPLEHRPRNVQAPRDDPISLTGILGADINDEPVGRGG